MTPKFTPEDDQGRTHIPPGKYPVVIGTPKLAPKPDSEGRDFYMVECEILQGDMKGQTALWNVSPHWMRFLQLHFMRATGMAHDMIVEPTFREDPKDPTSYDLNALLSNMQGNRVLMVLKDQKNKNTGEMQHTIADFEELKTPKGPVKQPAWIEVAKPVKPDIDDGVDLEKDMELEEDDSFLAN